MPSHSSPLDWLDEISPQQDSPRTLSEKLDALYHSLRPAQQRMADWQGGALAVSAVPGAGKSTGMAIATVILLGRRYLERAGFGVRESGGGVREAGGGVGEAGSGKREAGSGKRESRSQESGVFPTPEPRTPEPRTPEPPNPPTQTTQIVLVTFTRSAAANLRAKIRRSLRELGLPTSGFAVYTLHGLALNIATRHPELSGLASERLTLVTPNQNNRLIRQAVEQWISLHPRAYQQLLEGRQFDGEETERLRRQSVLRTEVLPALAETVIREGKSSGLSPEDLRTAAQAVRREVEEIDYDVMAIAAGLYEQYQTLLRQRQFIDYDDMILASLRVLDNQAARTLWQQQIFAVFEDEAQDSSPLQTRLLQILATQPTGDDALWDGSAEHQNLVRVGDPNQSINSTFTTADPLFFREFCEQCQRQGRLTEMDQAGRSSRIILEAANFMLRWVNERYTVQAGETLVSQLAPFRPQTIQPVPSDDPQSDANPQPEGKGLEIRFPPDTPRSVELLGLRVVELLTQHPERRAAVLVRENRQGKFVAELLRNAASHKLGVDLAAAGIEVYEVGERDRQSHVPAEVMTLLQFLDRPHSPDNLKAALRVLVDRQRIPPQDLNALSTQPEQFLYPGPLEFPQPDPIAQAQRYCCGLLHARLELPQYQLIPFLALTLGYSQSELATADKLAARIAQQTAANPSLSAILDALGEIVRSERFEPVETDDPDARYTRSRQLTIITMHKAKGLDWDYVFLPFLHEQSIPGRPWVLPQAQFLGDFSLPEVARAQIRASVHQQPMPTLEAAWMNAETLQTAEEFRLLYVAMTRAKRLLWMAAERKAPFTWSKPENLEDKLACPVVPALVQWLGKRDG